jgi:hypothetical protein
LQQFNICLLQSIINVAHILMPVRNLSLLQLVVIMVMENAAQGHTTVEEEEGIMKNWQLDGSGSNGSYHSPETQSLISLEGRGA